jgi:hypothetical protein
MRKHIIYVFIAISLLTLPSCNAYRLIVHSDNNFTLHILLLGVAILALVILFTVYNNRKRREEVAEHILNRQGLSARDFVESGTYIGGHPSVTEIIPSLIFRRTPQDFMFYIRPTNVYLPAEKFSIPVDSVTNIDLEDTSTVEEKVTAHRILLLGPFALAFKKQIKRDSCFVSIEWKEEKQIYNTYFYFDGYNAMLNANEFRYKLIAELNKS